MHNIFCCCWWFGASNYSKIIQFKSNILAQVNHRSFRDRQSLNKFISKIYFFQNICYDHRDHILHNSIGLIEKYWKFIICVYFVYTLLLHFGVKGKPFFHILWEALFLEKQLFELRFGKEPLRKPVLAVPVGSSRFANAHFQSVLFIRFLWFSWQSMIICLDFRYFSKQKAK